jgi:NAD(P)-dependent dehydrogenase (short-subunit alcohol dehydrogenase family)
MRAMRTLSDKVAIVTGGGSGIGLETAKLLAAEGAQVVIAGRRKEPLEAVVADIERRGGKVAARQANVATSEGALGLADWAIGTYGRVDILVNNAGHSSRARSIRWITPDDWDSVFAINIRGVYLLSQAVLPGMLERGEGTIITVASAAAIRASGLSGPAYSAAKAAALSLMRHIHDELRSKGIRATTILPAEVDTPILDKRPLPPDAEARATMMQPEDVAHAILLCATLPPRTVIEQIVMSPTLPRDLGAEVARGRQIGALESSS